MLNGSQRQEVLARISTSRVLATAVEHAALDRLPGSPGLEEAASRVAAELEQVWGLQVEAFSYPSGPDQRYFGWSDQRRPFPEKAELWLQTPDGGELLLCRRACELPRFVALLGELLNLLA